MWICDDCGATFVEPGGYKEIHTELEDCPSEYVSCCPECGGAFWSEAGLCGICQEYFATDDLIAGKICKGCMKDIIQSRRDLVQKFCEEEQEAFAEFAAEKLGI